MSALIFSSNAIVYELCRRHSFERIFTNVRIIIMEYVKLPFLHGVHGKIPFTQRRKVRNGNSQKEWLFLFSSLPLCLKDKMNTRLNSSPPTTSSPSFSLIIKILYTI